jgi:3-hydroxybutyryl-CoA dehydrogenase
LDEEVFMDRVGVVGCGLMGSGIAEIAARAGANVIIVEQDTAAMGRGPLSGGRGG